METATKTKPKINVDMQPRGIASAVCYAPFDEAKQALEKRGYKIISLQDSARLIVQEGVYSFVLRRHNYTSEGVVHIHKKGAFLTKNSPIMVNAEEATHCNRCKKEYYLTDEQVEEALTDAVKLSDKPIPTNRFKDNDITNYAFGDIAEEFGYFLKGSRSIDSMRFPDGVINMSISFEELQDKPFARQVHVNFWYPTCLLEASGSVLGDKCQVRGIKDIEKYTPKQIADVLKRLKSSRLEKDILSELRK